MTLTKATNQRKAFSDLRITLPPMLGDTFSTEIVASEVDHS